MADYPDSSGSQDSTQDRPSGASENASPPPTAAVPPVQPAPQPARERRRFSFARIIAGFLGLLLVLSVLMNAYLLVIVSVQMSAGLSSNTLLEGEEEQTVAVWTVDGVIDGDQVAAFRRFGDMVRTSEDVRAVVLRINSPGGGVSASDQIHREVVRMQQAGKPVVVSMGGVAASGGYYISAPADEILAEPTTITGSIGVLAAWPIIDGTLEKIGAKYIVLKSEHAEKWKDSISPLHEPSEEQRAHLYEMLDDMQARFEKVVVDGRGGKLLPLEGAPAVEPDRRPAPKYAAFNGKTFGTDEAVELGLVDDLGYVEDAFDRAAKLAGLEQPHIVQYYKRPPLLQQLGFESPRMGLEITVESLEEMQTPRVLYMWKVQ